MWVIVPWLVCKQGYNKLRPMIIAHMEKEGCDQAQQQKKKDT